MEINVVEQVTDVTRKMVRSMAELQKINERTMRELAKQQLQAAESFVAVGSKQMKAMRDLKSGRDLLNAHGEVVAEVGKGMLEHAKVTMELLARSQEALKGLIYQELNTVWNLSHSVSDDETGDRS